MNLTKAIATCALLCATPAAAVTIVDTGPGTAGTPVLSSLSPFQSLAAQFSTAQNYTVNSVEGWIQAKAGDTFEARIYTDGGDVPGALLYSANFSGISEGAKWLGSTGLSWDLLTGTYWVAFIGTKGSAAMPHPSASPLGKEAFRTGGGAWQSEDDLDIGVRIKGVALVNPGVGGVPEPATWAMMIVGFGAIGVGLRRRARPVEVQTA